MVTVSATCQSVLTDVQKVKRSKKASAAGASDDADAFQEGQSSDAQSFCGAEYRAYMKYFLHPLVTKRLKERLESSGDVPDCVVPAYRVPEEMRYDRRGNETNYKFTGPLQVETYKLRQICGTWDRLLNGAWEGLVNGKWDPDTNVPPDAYKPSCHRDKGGGPPYFVTLDNATAHTHWIDGKASKQHEENPGVSLLQQAVLSPRSHDIHQIVEHAVGCIKSRVNALCKAGCRRLPDVVAMDKAVQEGVKRFNAESWERNLPKLIDCLKVIATPRAHTCTVNMTCSRKKTGRETVQRQVAGTQGGYAPLELS